MDALIDEGVTSFKRFMGTRGLLFRRRADPQGDAEVGRDRAIDDDARRERPRDRCPRRAALLDRKDIAVLPRDRPGLADGGGGDSSRDHDRQPGRRTAVCRACQCQAGGGAGRARTRVRTSRRNLSAIPLSPLEEQLGAPGFEGAKWVCSTPLRARAEGHQTPCGRHSGPTTYRSSPPTTARSA